MAPPPPRCTCLYLLIAGCSFFEFKQYNCWWLCVEGGRINESRAGANEQIGYTHHLGRLTDFLTIQIEEKEEAKVISLKQLKL